MKNIIFIAPPAAGKGTLSDYLAMNYGYDHLSTGDLLRAEVKTGSELGKEIDALISKGKFVSDELIIRLVREKLMTIHNNPFILDGFPRTLNQAQKLDEMLVSGGVTNTVAIYLSIDIEEATKRAVGRVVCPNCSKSYNTYYPEARPKVQGICDDCGISLEKRSDDNEETFQARFQTYLKNTAPILDYYKEKGMLQEISSMGTPEEIINHLFDIINSEKELKRGGK